MTSPEQSKPEGEAPPHRYGTPRYCSAIETTLECVGGGAGPTEPAPPLPPLPPLSPLGLTGGEAVLAMACAGACCCCWATRAASSRRNSAWRAASCAFRCAISPWIEERSARREASWPSIDALSAARCCTSDAASALACFRRSSWAFTCLSKRVTSERTCVSCAEIRFAVL